MAEEVGFEPTVLSYNGFQDRRLKPLGHSSEVDYLPLETEIVNNMKTKGLKIFNVVQICNNISINSFLFVILWATETASHQPI